MESVIPEGQQSTYDNSHFSPAVIDGDRIFVSGVIGLSTTMRRSSAGSLTPAGRTFISSTQYPGGQK